MKKNTLSLLIGVILLLIALSIIFNSQSERNEDSHAGNAIIPSLYDKINDINKITIVNASGSTEISKTDKLWQITSKDNYLGNVTQIRKTLLELAELKIIEAKTKKEKNYSKLGVANLKAGAISADSNSSLITLKANNDVIASIIIGNKKSGHTPSVKSLTYVRLVENKQVWLVSGNLNIPDSKNFMDTEITNIAATRIQSIDINQAKGATVSINKAAQSDKEYSLKQLPKNKDLNLGAINSIASVLSNLSFDDVNVKTDDKKLSAPIKVKFTAFNGLTLDMNIVKDDSKYYLWLAASSSKPASVSLKKEDVEKKDQGPIASEEAKALNAKHSKWLYTIPAYLGENLTKELKDLVKDKPKPGPKAKK